MSPVGEMFPAAVALRAGSVGGDVDAHNLPAWGNLPHKVTTAVAAPGPFAVASATRALWAGAGLTACRREARQCADPGRLRWRCRATTQSIPLVNLWSGGDEMKWPEFVQLGQTLRIKAGHQVALINAAPQYSNVIAGVEDCAPNNADAVIGFVVRRGDLGLLGAVYEAALTGRVAWISYLKPGRLDTDLHRDWLARDVRRYGLQSVVNVSIDATWSALLLHPIEIDELDTWPADIDLAWPQHRSNNTSPATTK